MRKRLIKICFIGILACGIYGCAQTAEDVSVTEPETVQTENTETEGEETADAADAESKSEKIDISEEVYGQSEGQAGPIYIIEPGLTQDDTYEMQDWQAAYAEYIEGLEWNRDCTYSLIYVDDDDIPELVIDSGFEAGGCEILTYHSGEIDVLQTDRRLFYYIEKQNLFNNTGGLMGYYFDRIYSIENGKWACVADGEWTEKMGETDLIYQYEWDGEEVEEAVYAQSLNAVFDMEQKTEPERYYIMDEMMALFQTGDVMSQKHRYELFVEDVTWDEARSRCKERGGYLATITSTEEYERIQKGIEDSGLTDTAFWVGASDNEDVLGQKIFGFGWLEPNKEPADYCMLDHFNALFIFWEPDEPSYRVEKDGKTIKEDFAYLMYDDTEEKCYLYDAPMDMLSVWPEYTGKLGYICEYNPVTVMAKENWFYPSDGSLACWYEYEYDSVGNRIKEACYNVDNGIYERKEYEYDKVGKLTKETTQYGDDGKIYWYEYEYDSAGNQTKETNDKGVVCWEKEYDSAGNETKWIEYRYDGSVMKWRDKEYDSTGNMIRETAYKPDSDFEYRYEYEYDDAGNQTKEFYYTNGNIDYWVEYEYDGKGRQTGGTMYYASGSIWYIENEYDSRGKKTKIKITSSNDTEWAWEFEWKYDNIGNLTKYMEYRQGEIYIWREYEYITITPRNEAAVSADG